MREKLIELLHSGVRCPGTVASCGDCPYRNDKEVGCDEFGATADMLIANGMTMQERARTIDEWGEDYGDVLWWRFPIEEPPYVGSPLDCNWPNYHTHWTPIPIPELPKEDAE